MLTQSEFKDRLKRKKLPGLDGFRMVAVVSVIIHHFGYSGFFSARHGVSGFFVLSGFLITWLIIREYEKNHSFSIKKFYIRRSLRILPAYYFYVLISVSLDLMSGDMRILDKIVPALLYYTNYYNAFNGHPTSSLAHLWSLAIEEQFYLIWPIIFIISLRFNSYRRFLLWVGCGLIISVGAWRTIAVSYLEFDKAYVYNAFDMRFDNLLIGCIFAVLLQNALFLRFLYFVSCKPWMPIVTLLLLSVSISVDNISYSYGLAFTVDAILLGILLIQIVSLSDTRFWSWLNHPFVTYLGIISYPAYLWHIWALQLSTMFPSIPEVLQLLVALIATFFVSSASYLLVEKYFLKKKRNFS